MADSTPDWNAAACELAIEHSRTIEFTYKKGQSPSSTSTEWRSLEPQSLITNKYDDEVVVGHDPKRDDIRAFRLDRIVGSVAVR